MDGPPPDQMIGAPPSPRYDGRPIMDPVWPPRGDPAGENEFDFFSRVKTSVIFFISFSFSCKHSFAFWETHQVKMSGEAGVSVARNNK